RGALGVLHVDQRRRARDGHRFLDGADAHLRVDRRREVRGQLDPILDERAESLERERHLVEAWTEIDDRVSTLRVGIDRTGFLDQRRTRRLYRDTGQHTATRILDQAGDRA